MDIVNIMDFDMIDAMRAVGAVLVAVGIATLCRRMLFLRRSRRATGRLTAWKEEKSSSPSRGSSSLVTYYHAVVSFTAEDGSTHQIVSDTGSGKKRLPVGHPFPVRYDPRNPDDALIATAWELWGMAFICLGIGILLLRLAW